jgi:putative hydrolase of the HAD superfamily
LVFDLDDTLYPESEFVLSGFAAAGQWLHAQHGISGFEDRARQLFYAGRRGTIFDEALESLSAGHLRDVIPQMVETYRTHPPRVRLLPDAEEVLDWALAHDLRLALVTDGFGQTQRNKIEALRLAPSIGCRIVTDDLGGRQFWKPHPAGFRSVMEQLPAAPGEFVYVADNPRKDFIAPRQLGWRTVRIRRAGAEHSTYEATAQERADRDIRSLVELRDILSPLVS